MANKNNSNIVAIITMMFLFGMIAFVTNLAAPIGVIWKQAPGIEGSNALGMLGNFMNFLAYLFMGVPAGLLLTKIGYKKTALAAIAIGFFGVLIQFLSGQVLTGTTIAGVPGNFFVYLLGAFVAGFSVCMLNTVVNPMLTLLGGGGKKGNQYVQIGGTCNSLMATITPMIVGALIGSVTKETSITDVNPVLYIAMGVFLLAYVILTFIPVSDPEQVTAEGEIPNPWKFRHFVLGVIAIFVYVGIEAGIPGTLNFYLSDPTSGAGLDPSTAATIAGFVAGTYWFLMLVGRFVSSFISGKVSSKTQLTVVSAVALVLIIVAIFCSAATKVSMPVFNGSGFGMARVPIAALLLVLCGLCTSIMWGAIFNLAVEGLGSATSIASGFFMMMVVGGGIIPFVQNVIADVAGHMTSYWLIAACVAYILYFAAFGSKVLKRAE